MYFPSENYPAICRECRDSSIESYYEDNCWNEPLDDFYEDDSEYYVEDDLIPESWIEDEDTRLVSY